MANEGEYLIGISHIFRKEFVNEGFDKKYLDLEYIFYKKASKENILNFLNNTLNCNYEDIILTKDYPCNPRKLFELFK